MQPRRSQPAITIRSQKAVDRLKLLTRGGRSQTSVIEEALEKLCDSAPLESIETRRERMKRIIDEIQAKAVDSPFRFKTMAEFDAFEYDENGNCR
jgi:hypothetical protein